MFTGNTLLVGWSEYLGAYAADIFLGFFEIFWVPSSDEDGEAFRFDVDAERLTGILSETENFSVRGFWRTKQLNMILLFTTA